MFSARLARERGAIPFEVCSNRDKIRGKKTPSFSLSLHPSIHPYIESKKEIERRSQETQAKFCSALSLFPISPLSERHRWKKLLR